MTQAGGAPPLRCIAVVAEMSEGLTHRRALLTLAESLAREQPQASVELLVLGSDPAAAQTLPGEHCTVWQATHPGLHAASGTAAWAAAAAEALHRMDVQAHGQVLILLPPGQPWVELAARLAIALDGNTLGGCVGLNVRGGAVLARKPVFGGRAIATLRSVRWPCLAAVRVAREPARSAEDRLRVYASMSQRASPVAYLAKDGAANADGIAAVGYPVAADAAPAATAAAPPATGSADTAAIATANAPQTLELACALPSEFPSDPIASKDDGPALAGARLVVSGGRGMQGPEGFALLAQVAAQLDAALGGSLPTVDAGWIPVARQIGQSGKFVAPRTYFAVGISGTPQHLAGLSTESAIVALNKDPEADIFRSAVVGVIADWREILPLLLEELDRRRRR